MSKRALTVSVLTAGLSAGLIAGALSPAAAQGHEVGGKGSVYFLSGAINPTGQAQKVYAFGNADDEVYYGDWYGIGEDLPLVRRGNAFIVPQEGNPNLTSHTFYYGNPGDDVLIGDWDGDGTDSISVRRGNHYLVKNDNTVSGKADTEFYYGEANDVVHVGNWNGVVEPDGATEGEDNNNDGDFDDPRTPAYPGDLAPGDDDGYDHDKDGNFTEAEDRLPGTGIDNNKDGDYTDPPSDAIPADVAPGVAKGDTLMIQRGNQFFVKNSTTTGKADYTFYFGDRGDEIVVGDWASAATPETKDAEAKPAASGDGADQLAVVRGNRFFKSSELAAAHAGKKNPTTIESLYYGDQGDNVFIAKLNTELLDEDGNHVDPVDSEGAPIEDNLNTVGDESIEIVGDGFGVRR